MDQPTETDVEEMRKMKRNGATAREIEEETGWSNSCVARHTRNVTKKWKDPEWLRVRRWDRGMSCREIAEEVPVGEATISKWCNNFGVSHEWQCPDACHDLYVEQEKSIPDLAERWGLSTAGTRRALIVVGVDRREPTHGKPGDTISGAAAYGKQWREVRQKAIERDDFTCQEDGCNESGMGLDVHHIKPVDSFDDFEDAHTLDNLVTFCRSHHKQAENNICPSTEGR